MTNPYAGQNPPEGMAYEDPYFVVDPSKQYQIDYDAAEDAIKAGDQPYTIPDRTGSFAPPVVV